MRIRHLPLSFHAMSFIALTEAQNASGGSLVMQNGMLDRLLFDGGYAKATVVSPTTYRFAFYYYNHENN